MREFLTKFQSVSNCAMNEQTVDLAPIAKIAVEASFQKQCVNYLAHTAAPAYNCLIHLWKFALLDAAFAAVMDQYKAAVENKYDVKTKDETEFNPFGKKIEKQKPVNNIQKDVAQYVKAFLAAAAPPERCGHMICYNCNRKGHIAMYCRQEDSECGKKKHPGERCPF
ncbi:hypothetical protein DSO57_1006148 [Entomophthora muscae]|uniref:Uncharacterized protein n=1 Tax=Entomophthora muscae TaxID=34485 RepID=A0ACC2UHG3_9FUNG|nr:hypothetical protein DSO57_1006148 [Entomophthora muscae]